MKAVHHFFSLLVIHLLTITTSAPDAHINKVVDTYLYVLKNLHENDRLPVPDVSHRERIFGVSKVFEASCGSFGQLSDVYRSRNVEVIHDGPGKGTIVIRLSTPRMDITYERVVFGTMRMKIREKRPMSIKCESPTLVIKIHVEKFGDGADGCRVRISHTFVEGLHKCQVVLHGHPLLSRLMSKVGRLTHFIFNERINSKINEQLENAFSDEVDSLKNTFCWAI